MDEGPSNKAERLAVAGAVAPYLRENAAKAKQRRVGRLAEDGTVVGYTTLDKVQESLLARAKIELAVQEGVRPKAIFCRRCGQKQTVEVRKGRIPQFCSRCRNASCVDCGGVLTKARSNITGRCLPCHNVEQVRQAGGRKTCIECGKVVSQSCKKRMCSGCYRKSRHVPKKQCLNCGLELGSNSVYKNTKHCRKCAYAHSVKWTEKDVEAAVSLVSRAISLREGYEKAAKELGTTVASVRNIIRLKTTLRASDKLPESDDPEWLDPKLSPLGRRKILRLISASVLPGRLFGRRMFVERLAHDNYARRIENQAAE